MNGRDRNLVFGIRAPELGRILEDLGCAEQSQHRGDMLWTNYNENKSIISSSVEICGTEISIGNEQIALFLQN
jgi:hypothetical protein